MKIMSVLQSVQVFDMINHTTEKCPIQNLAVQRVNSIMRSIHKIVKHKLKTCCKNFKVRLTILWIITLCENCPNTEFFLIRIFPYLDWIRKVLRISPYLVRMRENTDQKKLRIWTLFTQCKLYRVNLDVLISDKIFYI